MNTIGKITDNELWSLPYDSLMEILERDAMEKLEGMTRDELKLLYEDAIEKRKKNCDIKKIAQQTDEENHECIKLSVFQNVVIDKTRELVFADGYPELYHRMKSMSLTFRDVEKALSGPMTINGEAVNYIPSFDEVVEYMHSIPDTEENRQCA